METETENTYFTDLCISIYAEKYEASFMSPEGKTIGKLDVNYTFLKTSPRLIIELSSPKKRLTYTETKSQKIVEMIAIITSAAREMADFKNRK